MGQSPLWQESFLEGLWVASFSAYPRPPFCPTVKNQTIAAYHQMVSYRIQTRKYGKWCLKDAIQMISYTIWATIICKHNLWLTQEKPQPYGRCNLCLENNPCHCFQNNTEKWELGIYPKSQNLPTTIQYTIPQTRFSCHLKPT